MKPNGFIIHEGSKNGSKFAVIATLKTSNRKTGNMIQLWILLSDHSPVDGVKSGLDASTICTGCKFASGNGCYVNVGQAPNSIWKAYKANKYPKLDPFLYDSVFNGRKVRFGAYGNPSLIPLSIIKMITESCDGWTGYFHDWKEMSKERATAYGNYFMASTETNDSVRRAKEKNLRYFHVSPEQPKDTIECLADSKGLSCDQCQLCKGNRIGAKSIWINPHGSKKKRAIEQAISN
jgi:hypothetical protein